MRTALGHAAVAAITSGIFVALISGDAGAAPRCGAPVSGTASGLGILGIGSAVARDEARRNWSANAAIAYGPRYASFDNARSVRWSCKPGFILPATCVVYAAPCRW